AFGINGIPNAFVIDKDGRIVWQGHPAYPEDRMDNVIQKVVAGTWDKEAAEKEEQDSKDKMEKDQEKAAKEMQTRRKSFETNKKKTDEFVATIKKKGMSSESVKEQGTKLLETLGTKSDNSILLNQAGWTILANKHVKDRD